MVEARGYHLAVLTYKTLRCSLSIPATSDECSPARLARLAQAARIARIDRGVDRVGLPSRSLFSVYTTSI